MSEKTPKAKKLMQTLPLVMASSLALSLNLAPAQEAKATPQPEKRPPHNDARKATVEAIQRDFTPNDTAAVTVAQNQLSYIVKKGDTVSAIAARHGLSTASVLALNGLGWSSLIFPGQQLILSKGTATPLPANPAPVEQPSAPATPAAPASENTLYVVKSGDTVSKIAAAHSVTTSSVLALNGLSWSSIIYPKQQLKIPAGSQLAAAPAATTPAAPTTPAASTPAPSTCTGVSYVIVSGDTVSKIAGKFGVSVQQILQANGLGLNSLIFAGQTLNIPGATLITQDCQVYAELTTEMRINAKIIVEVGRAAGVSDYGLVIALATAMQESGLRNLNYGDRDSLGLFQQRPSQGWGSAAEVMDPYRAARAFFGGPVNPNPGLTRGLLDIAGWEQMTVTQAAQAVQISGFPDAYAKWESSARNWLKQLK